MSAVMSGVLSFLCSENLEDKKFKDVNQATTCQVFDKIKEVVSLREMKLGQRARVVHIQAYGELGRRIRDMGLIPGAEVTIIGRAPLKDPVALRLLGFTLSLRNNEAEYVMVTPI